MPEQTEINPDNFIECEWCGSIFSFSHTPEQNRKAYEDHFPLCTGHKKKTDLKKLLKKKKRYTSDDEE